MPATGGVARPLTDFGYLPQWSPDGQRILFTNMLVNHLDDKFWIVTSGQDPQPLTFERASGGAFGWGPGSHHIVALSAFRFPFGVNLASLNIETQQPTSWAFAAPVLEGFREHALVVPASGWHGARTSAPSISSAKAAGSAASGGSASMQPRTVSSPARRASSARRGTHTPSPWRAMAAASLSERLVRLNSGPTTWTTRDACALIVRRRCHARPSTPSRLRSAPTEASSCRSKHSRAAATRRISCCAT